MIKYCLDKWNANSQHLREAIIAKGSQMNRCNYDDLVKLVVKEVYNRHTDDSDCIKWDSETIHEIDDGDYQGTLLYLIPEDTYQPGEYEYLMTTVGYGSCSVCDTLQSIQDDYSDDGPLTKQQIDDYMLLCKDIVTNTIKPYNFRWRDGSQFDLVEFE